MSAPAQKSGPLPEMTAARMSLSFASERKQLVMDAIMSSSKALRAWGRCNTTRATGPRFSRGMLTALHPQNGVPNVLQGGMGAGLEAPAHDLAGVGGS